jgi:thymidylate synthase
MKLSRSQIGLHWRLWARVKASLMNGRETWTKHEEDQRRHELYTQALGEEKSLTELDNDDFDKVKAAMLAIVEPGNLNAQLHALNGQRKRLLFGIRRLAKSMGGDEHYVAGIVENDERRGQARQRRPGRAPPARADESDGRAASFRSTSNPNLTRFDERGHYNVGRITKRVHFKSVLVELLWFLRGDTNVEFLHAHGVTIWDEWADKNGDLGPVYGKQWRRWVGRAGERYDQIGRLIGDLITTPQSRRHIVSAWNVADVDRMALPPCHTLWQCYVRERSFLDLHLYARSIDIFLGLPFNIAGYALLLHILGTFTRLAPGELIISFGDLHLYANRAARARSSNGSQARRQRSQRRT